MWMKHRMEIWWKETTLWVARSVVDVTLMFTISSTIFLNICLTPPPTPPFKQCWKPGFCPSTMLLYFPLSLSWLPWAKRPTLPLWLPKRMTNMIYAEFPLIDLFCLSHFSIWALRKNIQILTHGKYHFSSFVMA